MQGSTKTCMRGCAAMTAQPRMTQWYVETEGNHSNERKTVSEPLKGHKAHRLGPAVISVQNSKCAVYELQWWNSNCEMAQHYMQADVYKCICDALAAMRHTNITSSMSCIRFIWWHHQPTQKMKWQITAGQHHARTRQKQGQSMQGLTCNKAKRRPCRHTNNKKNVGNTAVV
jgi:hypothetical protein